MLIARLHRHSAERHTLALSLDDRPLASVELETRSFLVHDLVHWCVEAELELDEGFWGLLASGVPLEVLNDREMPPSTFTTLGQVEGLVGPLQSYLQGRLPRQLLVEALPASFTPANLSGVEARFKTALGAWKATPFGAALELTWPPGAPVVIS
ncbi:MAG: hypothetical protein GQE15_37140 [Archangiaceae bacterium]|nr:hypothetical protein [Archangiaceae bacterium]